MRRTWPALFLAMGCAAPDAGKVRECRPAGRSGCPSSVGGPFIDPLRHLGRGESSDFIEITDVVSAYPLVYACTGVRGLMVWDASADGPKRLVEKVAPPNLSDPTFPRCQHVGLDGTRVVITNRGDEVQPDAWVWAYDVADSRAPRELAGWRPLSGSVEGVVLEGDRVYVARHTTGVTVLELGSELTELGTFADADSDAWQPVKLGDTLIVAEGEAGLRTYNVAGDMPMLLAALPLTGSSRDVVLEGDRAYVATSGGVAVVDVSDPGTPVLLGEVATAGTALGLSLVAPGTVVVAEWDELRGYDLSDPAAPRTVFTESVPTSSGFSRVLAVDAALAEGRVYAGEWEGLHQFQFSEGNGPDIGVAPQSLQFGNVAAGDRESAVLVVRNNGDATLTVHDVATADVVGVDQDCFQVEPGAALAVEVDVSPGDVTDLRTDVVLCSDDADQPERAVSLTANISGVGVGDPVPSFTLQDTTGETWSSDDLAGRVTVLAYFATF